MRSNYTGGPRWHNEGRFNSDWFKISETFLLILLDVFDGGKSQQDWESGPSGAAGTPLKGVTPAF